MTDIALNNSGEIVWDKSINDTFLVSGDAFKIQDTKSRLLTPIGTMFYDRNYGSNLLYHIQRELSDESLLELEESIQICLKESPFINTKTISLGVKSERTTLIIQINFSFLENDKIEQISVEMGREEIRVL